MVSILTALLHEDTTKPSTTNVKVAHPLLKDGWNFKSWLYDLTTAAIHKECTEAFQKPLPFTRANAAAMMLITGSVPVEWSPMLTMKPSAFDALLYIANKFTGGHNKSVNRQWLHTLKTEHMTREETFETFVMKKFILFQNLLDNSHSIDPEDVTNAIVDCLPTELAQFKGALYGHCCGRSSEDVVKILQSHAYGAGFNDQLPRPLPKAAAVLPKSQDPEADQSEQDRKRSRKVRCWECGSRGHISKECTKWKKGTGEEQAGDRSKHSLPSVPSASNSTHVPCPKNAEAVPISLPSVTFNVLQSGGIGHSCEEWLVDSGATVHLVNDFGVLQNPTVYTEPRQLQLATSESHGSIIASGSVCLVNAEGQLLWLHNVQCVPQASTNLLSVSAGVRDGIQFVPRENGTYSSLVGPMGWECSIVERYGLYVLRGIYPTKYQVACQVCVNPMSAHHAAHKPAHNCKLRKLWHERLGHPGKTATERLSREELCTGIPVSLLPCSKCDTHCDPCVRGKQCKPSFKPSSHEPPRVLHRIHADTVGAMSTPGVEGEKFSVTVVDELSNFVSVLPVTSKATIASHLTDTITYWERQTESKVKAVRTDRGTEFLNKTFHGFCTENGIHTETSAAYTPQQNGVAERMNRTLKEKARTLLLGVQADESLWVDAMLTAAYLHNVMPVSGQEKTPFEMFTGSVPDLSHLRKWGCLAYVKHAKHQVSSLGAQSEAGMFVGYCPHTKGYKVRLPGRTVVSPSVHFVESQSGASAIGLQAAGPGPVSATQPGSSLDPDPASPQPGPSLDQDLNPVELETPASTEATIPMEDNSSEDDEPSPARPQTARLHPDPTAPRAPCAPPARTRHSNLTAPCAPAASSPVASPGSTAPRPASSSQSPGVSEVPRRMHAATRHGTSAPTTSGGIRTIARLRLMAVPLAKSPTSRTPGAFPWPGGTARFQLQPGALTRAERLQQRNARKEQPKSGDITEQAGIEAADEAPTTVTVHDDTSTEEGGITTSREPGEAGDVGEAGEAECTGRGTGVDTDSAVEGDSSAVDQCSDDNAVAMHVRDEAVGRLVNAKCESDRETRLRVSNVHDAVDHSEMVCENEEMIPAAAVREDESGSQEARRVVGEMRSRGKVAFFDNLPSATRQSSDNPWAGSARIVRDILHEQDGAEPSGEMPSCVFRTADSGGDASEPASIAFLRACLASPAGVRFSKIPVPSNYREARMSDQWVFWEQAMIEEKNSLDAHECFEYTERPRGKKVIPVHWIYSVKVDAHGNVIRYKARLVAQGCRQIQGIDVDEVFAPTSSFGARRVLLCKAAAEDMEIHQLDIKTAFLNGDLEEEVYVTQPPGFHNGGPQVCRLRKALYGLKQAPRAWYHTLDATLAKHGFTACMSDAGIYVSNVPGEDPVYLVLFVDDMLIMSKALPRVLAFKETIGKEFSIHDLGEVKDFLGCQIVRDRERKLMWMSSGLKIDALVDSFGLSGDTRAYDTPMSKSFVHTSHSTQSNPIDGAGVALEPGHRYCELIGSLLYLANTTRPDIAHAVGVLSRYRGTPTTAHMQEGLRVVRYLKDTRDLALQLGGGTSPLEGYVDADYAGDLDMRASTTGFVFQVYGGSVVWGSKKQSATATSTVESEFRAASHAVKEAIWLRGFLEEIHVDVWKPPLFIDNSGCVRNLRNLVNSKYTKHVAVAFHHARAAVIQGDVDVKYVPTQKNVADIFTKPLVPVLFKIHRNTLGVVSRE